MQINFRYVHSHHKVISPHSVGVLEKEQVKLLEDIFRTTLTEFKMMFYRLLYPRMKKSIFLVKAHNNPFKTEIK